MKFKIRIWSVSRGFWNQFKAERGHGWRGYTYEKDPRGGAMLIL